jgi:hypothetical protein
MRLCHFIKEQVKGPSAQYSFLITIHHKKDLIFTGNLSITWNCCSGQMGQSEAAEEKF